MTMLLASSTFGILSKPSHDAGFMGMRACASSSVSPLRSEIGVRGLCLRSTGLQHRRCCAFAMGSGGHIELDPKASTRVVVTREHGKNGKLMKALVRCSTFFET